MAALNRSLALGIVAMLAACSFVGMATLATDDSEAAYTETNEIKPLIKGQSYGISTASTQVDLFEYDMVFLSDLRKTSGDLPSGMAIGSSQSGVHQRFYARGTPDSDGSSTILYTLKTGSSVVGRFTTTFIVNSQHNYTVLLNANGGAGGAGMVSQASSLVSGSISLTIPNAVPTRDGFAFVGWGESSTATTATYHPGDTYVMPVGLDFTGDIVNQQIPLLGTQLYAVWEKMPLNVSDRSVICGTSLSITPAPSGTMTVSGADWLTVVNGNVITGTAPDVPGEWTVTVSDGTTSATFTVTVVPALTFVSVPNPMAFAFEV